MINEYGRYEYIQPIQLACGAEAEFDEGSGCAHRCTTCGAVVGSVGMPRECAELERIAEEKQKIWKILNKV